MLPHLLKAGVNRRVIDLCEPGKTYTYKDLASIRPEPLVHDVPNCGWHVAVGRIRCFYATDCRDLEGVQAPGYEYLLIEGNYGESEIWDRISAKQASGEYVYELDAMQRHMSREYALGWIAEQSPGAWYMLLHGHGETEVSYEP